MSFLELLENTNHPARLRNLLHSLVLIAGIALIAGLCAWLLFGISGLIWTAVAVGLVLLIGPRIAPDALMRMYGARPVDLGSRHPVVAILRMLAQRAGLPAVPRLYVVPSPVLNAFATGKPQRASIAITHGMLTRLELREIAGVLAHEISHIRNGDLWIMGLADIFSRLTQFMSYFGIFLVFLNLPLMLIGQAHIPWLAVLLLYFAPTISSLLQLALSRTREYDADLEGARLTGDPSGLASALAKLERYQGQFWEQILFPGRKLPEPSLLRSHPPTEERIKRLRELEAEGLEPIPLPGERVPLFPGLDAILSRPRYRWTGLWY